MKKFSIILVILVTALALLVSNRHLVLLRLASFVDIPLLIEKQDEGPSVSWQNRRFLPLVTPFPHRNDLSWVRALNQVLELTKSAACASHEV